MSMTLKSKIFRTGMQKIANDLRGERAPNPDKHRQRDLPPRAAKLTLKDLDNLASKRLSF